MRVACPARGTSLMGGRIDRWLNMVFDVASFALGGRLNPITRELLDGLRALVQATVKERTDPETLPGLAAMSPDFSPLLEVLNRQHRRQQDELRVIAGDIEPSGVLRRVMIWFADMFFGEDHDLVVDTRSMDGGTRRQSDPQVFLDRGTAVSHFNYFANDSSASVLVRALTSEETIALGAELAAQPEGRCRNRAIAATAICRSSFCCRASAAAISRWDPTESGSISSTSPGAVSRSWRSATARSKRTSLSVSITPISTRS